MQVGMCRLEFMLRDMHSGCWHKFREDFVVIDGKRTFIVGMPFCKPAERTHANINLDKMEVTLDHAVSNTLVTAALLHGCSRSSQPKVAWSFVRRILCTELAVSTKNMSGREGSTAASPLILLA